jgi:hypothetical protein
MQAIFFHDFLPVYRSREKDAEKLSTWKIWIKHDTPSSMPSRGLLYISGQHVFGDKAHEHVIEDLRCPARMNSC